MIASLLFFPHSINANTDSITGIGINLHPTMHHVGIQVNYSGDNNQNANASVEANINNEGFKTIHRLSRVADDRFIGTVFSIPQESTVQVRVTLFDPDGVINDIFTDETETRSESVPKSEGKIIHVSVDNGDDQTGNGTAESPYASIQYATEFLKPDITLLIHAGVYHEEVEISTSYIGEESKPATIRSAGDGEVILEGFSPQLKEPSNWSHEGNDIYSAVLDNTYFISVDGKRLWRYDSFEDLEILRFKNNGGFYVDQDIQKVYVKLPDNEAPDEHEIQVSTLKVALTLNNISHLVIDGLTFRGYGATIFSDAISIAEETEEIWIVNNTFENLETAIWLEGYSEDITIMNNDFSDEGITDFDWDALKEHQTWLERGAVFCSNDDYSGRSLMFYKNTVHDMFDGIKVTSLDSLDYATNTDVEENIFSNLSDDGVETDGWSSNIRIVNNRFEHLLAGVSVAPAIGGPTYIVGNIMDNLRNIAGTDYETNAVKFNVSDEDPSGEIFIYHNTATTFEENQAAFSITNHTLSEGVFVKNNIWAGTRYSMYYWLNTELNFHEDYNLHFSDNDEVLILYQGIEHPSLESYIEASNLCENCLSDNPLFQDYEGGDYNLTESSPAIDKGELINGINDYYFGDAPDMGAMEYIN